MTKIKKTKKTGRVVLLNPFEMPDHPASPPRKKRVQNQSASDLTAHLVEGFIKRGRAAQKAVDSFLAAERSRQKS